MRQPVASCVFSIIASLALACFGGERAPLPTVDGQEADNLLAATRGYVVTEHRSATGGWQSEIDLTTLPSLGAWVVRPRQEGSYSRIALFSGPDDRGRVAYVQTNWTGDTAQLNIINGDRSNYQVIATAIGPQYRVFGTHLALAPVGGALAFMSKVQDAWPNGEYVSTGLLNVWRPESKDVAVVATDVDDQGLAWFPDGIRLAYVARVQRGALGDSATTRLTRGTQACEGKATGQDVISVVFVVDVRSGVRRALHAGANPVVSTDGASVLMECGSAILVDTAGKSTRRVGLPGDMQRPLALLNGRLAIYWGLPTHGMLVVRSPYGSFGAGTQEVTIKVADLETGRFQTIVPVIDPRGYASFSPSTIIFDTMSASRAVGRVVH